MVIPDGFKKADAKGCKNSVNSPFWFFLSQEGGKTCLRWKGRLCNCLEKMVSYIAALIGRVNYKSVLSITLPVGGQPSKVCCIEWLCIIPPSLLSFS